MLSLVLIRSIEFRALGNCVPHEPFAQDPVSLSARCALRPQGFARQLPNPGQLPNPLRRSEASAAPSLTNVSSPELFFQTSQTVIAQLT